MISTGYMHTYDEGNKLHAILTSNRHFSEEVNELV